MLNNYDKIANQYDFMSRLVFFKSQVNAQINQLKYLPKNGSILVVGGGTGWILEEISKLSPKGLKIVYVEISAKMVALSKQRNFGDNEVQIVNQGIEEFDSSILFDAILTPFLFDNFSKERVEFVFEKLSGFLKPCGLWLFVDFCVGTASGQWWKLFLLKAMYRFFKLLSIVEASQLIETKPYFEGSKYTLIDESRYFGGFIRASVYKKA
ncbi:methyltransferase type 12 [Pedobacter yonginense]|uniref:Methyltransferase type 12 n=1 Tax=Pedobacter yonginense TaxID=651869 RepID=A0A317EM28_9SPHI|nr:class I SAM-dependent methyltransferase [Pedobacter yonginense]PWS27435.1 methyltransferase type 12 [Pedobacter yonginense]